MNVSQPRPRRRRKALALLLCLLLAAGGLTACFDTVDLGTPVLTMGDYTLGTVELTYWAATMKTVFLREQNATGNDTAAFWNGKLNDTETRRQHFDAMLLNWLKELVTVKYLANLYGITLDKTAKEEVRAEIADKKQYYEEDDDLAGWEAQLSRLGVTEESLREIYLNERLRLQLRTYFETDLTMSDIGYANELAAYFHANYVNVRYAVIYTSHDGLSGADLGEEQRARKEEKIQEMLRRAAQGEDTDTLITAYSEYDMSSLPNGSFFCAADAQSYGETLVNTVLSMEDGAWTRIDLQTDGVSYTYVLTRVPLGERNYSEMSDTELEALGEHCKDAYYAKRIAAFADRITLDSAVWEQYPVTAIPASKNTNI